MLTGPQEGKQGNKNKIFTFYQKETGTKYPIIQTEKKNGGIINIDLYPKLILIDLKK